MNNKPTENDLATHLRRLDLELRIALICASGLLLFSIGWLLVYPGRNRFLPDNLYTLSSLMGAIFIWRMLSLQKKGPVSLAPHYQRGWKMIGWALIFNCLGGIWYTYQIASEMRVSFISPATIAFVLFYLFLCWGLLLLAYNRYQFQVHLPNLFDALLIALSLFSLGWFFYIGPAFDVAIDIAKVRGGSPLELSLMLIYPCLGIGLLFALIIVIYSYAQESQSAFYPVLFLLTVSILAHVWADVRFTNLAFLNTFVPARLSIDPFWFLSFLLLGIAAFLHYRTFVVCSQSVEEPSWRKGNFLGLFSFDKENNTLQFLQALPFIAPLLLIFILLIYARITDLDLHVRSLEVIATCASVLFICRYLFTIHESEILRHEREERKQEADNLRSLMAQLTSTLDLDLLLERIVDMAASHLPFERSLLLFFEANDVPASPDADVYIRAASVASDALAKVTTWNIYSDQQEYIALFKYERTITHEEEQPMLPEELLAWKDQHSIRELLLLPITYQGRELGCLGLGRVLPMAVGEHERALAKAFVEQVAIAIEHARLYREVYEHDNFAKSLANIATRLNSAVAKPAEIQQLICTEAALALQADFVLLYLSNKDNHLSPAAVSARGGMAFATAENWPDICLHEEVARAYVEHQPFLTRLTPAFPTVLRGRSARPVSSSCLLGSDECRGCADQGLCGQGNLPLQEVLEQRGVYSAVFTPLGVGNETSGLLILARSFCSIVHEKRSYTSIHLAQAQDFAEQAGVAFTNARMYQQLQELDQLKDQFIETASHELRTPLTSVQGYIDLLVHYQDKLAADEREDFLLKAQRACDELVLLLGNVMDASRLEIEAGIRPALIEVVSVADVIQSVIGLAIPQLKKEQRETVIEVKAGLRIKADVLRLRQVLLNLTMNALKYSPAPMPLHFTAYLEDDGMPQRACAIIKVTDFGNGIPLQDQGRLFQRFVRLERDINSLVRGSGLGLYISRRLIEAMGGTIWVESSGRTGEGTTFCIRLPAAV